MSGKSSRRITANYIRESYPHPSTVTYTLIMVAERNPDGSMSYSIDRNGEMDENVSPFAFEPRYYQKQCTQYWPDGSVHHFVNESYQSKWEIINSIYRAPVLAKNVSIAFDCKIEWVFDLMTFHCNPLKYDDVKIGEMSGTYAKGHYSGSPSGRKEITPPINQLTVIAVTGGRYPTNNP